LAFKFKCPVCKEKVDFPEENITCPSCGSDVRRTEAIKKASTPWWYYGLGAFVVLNLLLTVYGIFYFYKEGPEVFWENKMMGQLDQVWVFQEKYKKAQDCYGRLHELFIVFGDKVPWEAEEQTRSCFTYYLKSQAGFDDWSCIAFPVHPGKNKRSLYIDQTRVIRYAPFKNKESILAGPDSPILKN